MAAENWERVDGSTDMDVLKLPLDRFCNRVLAWARSLVPPREWSAFQFRLDLPPPGETPTSGPWSEEAIAATFAERNA